MKTTKLTIEVSTELSELANARAQADGINLNELIQTWLIEFANGRKLEKTIFRARVTTIEDFIKNPPQPPSAEEVQTNLANLKEMQSLGDKISRHWAPGVSAVEAISQDRSRLD
jgi:hypothetical protein